MLDSRAGLLVRSLHVGSSPEVHRAAAAGRGSFWPEAVRTPPQSCELESTWARDSPPAPQTRRHKNCGHFNECHRTSVAREPSHVTAHHRRGGSGLYDVQLSPFLPYHRLLCSPLRTLLVRIGRAQKRFFFEGATDDLEPNRKPCLTEPTGQRDRWHTGEVCRNGKNVRQIHLERVVTLRSELEAGVGVTGVTMRSTS
jgi:hypothetical protein